MALTTDFNVDPYYDDYDEDKGFYRILFRPGYAVQAREVTQLQTILQKQVERYGEHLFEDGVDAHCAVKDAPEEPAASTTKIEVDKNEDYAAWLKFIRE